jgi:hypothetical protein
MTSEPPQWVKDYVDLAVKALGLGEWDITVAMKRIIGGEDDRWGTAWVQYEYESADIELRDNLEADRNGRTIILHELLHLANKQRELAARAIIAMLPEDRRAEAKEIWRIGKEQDIVHESRALARALVVDVDNPADNEPTTQPQQAPEGWAVVNGHKG